jgi:hypothetical protein
MMHNFSPSMKSSPAQLNGDRCNGRLASSSFQCCNGAASPPGLAVSGWVTCPKSLLLFNRRDGPALFFIQELIRRNTGLFEDRPQSVLPHIAGMVGNGGVSVRLCVVPDLVTAGCLAVEGKAKRLEMLGYLPVTKSRLPPHLHPQYQGAVEGIAD